MKRKPKSEMTMNDFLKRCEQKGYDNTRMRYYRRMMRDIELESIYAGGE